jgi:hypothetical protein
MGQDKGEFWWLLALKATLFLSLPCWVTASYAQPASYPIRFAACLVAATSVSALVFHVGPALFAARFGSREYPFSWVLSLCVAAGYMYYALRLAEFVARSFGDKMWLAAEVTFLLALLVVGFVKSWWKPVLAAGLLHGAGILAWMLTTPWNGLWTRNTRMWLEPPQFDQLLVKAMLLVAAPAAVIGWRIGHIEPGVRRIWLSGVIGVFLPLVFAVSIASFAAEAGENLYWRPSLPLGFEWALLGFRGQAEPGIIPLVVWTVTWPALLCIVSLRLLAKEWKPTKRALLLLPAAGCVVFDATVRLPWLYDDQVGSDFATWPYQIWAAGLAIAGAATVLSCLIWRRTKGSTRSEC